MRNRLSNWLLVVIALVAPSLWWLLIDTDRGASPAKPIHIAELRQLAATVPGHRPTSVTYTVLAARKVAGDIYAAGIGLKRRPLAIIVWVLPVPGQGPIMIDPGLPPASGAGRFSDVDEAAQSRIDAEARTASLILRTQGQEEAPRAANPLVNAGMRVLRPAQPTAVPVSYVTAQAVAPGVVVIPAFSAIPGARLIFVQLADGREYLFAGNIAPLTENWARLRAQSHLAAAWGPAQDRAETYAWLRTIRQLRMEAPKMKVVPGHDLVWLDAQQGAGAIAEQPASAEPAKTP